MRPPILVIPFVRAVAVMIALTVAACGVQPAPQTPSYPTGNAPGGILGWRAGRPHGPRPGRGDEALLYAAL